MLHTIYGELLFIDDIASIMGEWGEHFVSLTGPLDL